jgi:hypothetical protein
MYLVKQMSNSRHGSEAKCMDIKDSTSPLHKRNAKSDRAADHRKNKSTKATHSYEPRAHYYWYGFLVMEAITVAGGHALETNKLTIPELLELGWLENDVLDCYNRKITFPRVTQHFWLHTRRDKKPGHWYHFT